ncbi:unnamed protein product [Cochlearia groenlandica]
MRPFPGNPEGCKVPGKRRSLSLTIAASRWEVGEGSLLEERLGYLHSTCYSRRKGVPPGSSLSRATGRRTTTASCSRPAASFDLIIILNPLD